MNTEQVVISFEVLQSYCKKYDWNRQLCCHGRNFAGLCEVDVCPIKLLPNNNKQNNNFNTQKNEYRHY